jgi:hypothetical protein
MYKSSFSFKSPTKSQVLFFGFTITILYAVVFQFFKLHLIQQDVAKLIIIGWTAGFFADFLGIDLIEKPVQYFLFVSLINIPCMLFLAKF